MRDLTEEELKLAPDWATHYFIDTDYDDEVVYESVDLCWWKSLDSPIMHWGVMDGGARLLPQKPFSISEYEFSCESVKACKPSWVGGDLQISILDGDFTHHDAVINKEDAIAIAKALGVTAEDLRS